MLPTTPVAARCAFSWTSARTSTASWAVCVRLRRSFTTKSSACSPAAMPPENRPSAVAPTSSPPASMTTRRRAGSSYACCTTVLTFPDRPGESSAVPAYRGATRSNARLGELVRMITAAEVGVDHVKVHHRGGEPCHRQIERQVERQVRLAHAVVPRHHRDRRQRRKQRMQRPRALARLRIGARAVSDSGHDSPGARFDAVKSGRHRGFTPFSTDRLPRRWESVLLPAIPSRVE